MGIPDYYPFIEGDLPQDAAMNQAQMSFVAARKHLVSTGTPQPCRLSSILASAFAPLQQSLDAYKLAPIGNQEAVAYALAKAYAALFIIHAGLRRDAPAVAQARLVAKNTGG